VATIQDFVYLSTREGNVIFNQKSDKTLNDGRKCTDRYQYPKIYFTLANLGFVRSVPNYISLPRQ